MTRQSPCDIFGLSPSRGDGGFCLSLGRGLRADIGNEAYSTRIFDQMQHALEVAVLGLRAPDIYYRRILEPDLKEANDAIASVIIQGVEDLINHDPVRFVEHDTCKDQVLLLIIGEFPLPARNAVQ